MQHMTLDQILDPKKKDPAIKDILRTVRKLKMCYILDIRLSTSKMLDVRC